MRCNKLSLGLRVALAIFALTFFVTSALGGSPGEGAASASAEARTAI